MTLRTPPKSLVIFLGLVMAVGAVVHHLFDGIGLAAFFLFISSIEGKPAWKWFFDPPGEPGQRPATERVTPAGAGSAPSRRRSSGACLPWAEASQLGSAAWKPSTN